MTRGPLQVLSEAWAGRPCHETPMRRIATLTVAALSFLGSRAAVGAEAKADADAPVSFTRDLRPLLNAHCNACHKPDKSKGDLDMSDV